MGSLLRDQKGRRPNLEAHPLKPFGPNGPFSRGPKVLE